MRVAVYAAGLNFADILSSQGKYQEKPPLPFTPGNSSIVASSLLCVGGKCLTNIHVFVTGSEYAGSVISTASGVDGFKPGDRVFGLALQQGCFAEEAIVPSYVRVCVVLP